MTVTVPSSEHVTITVTAAGAVRIPDTVKAAGWSAPNPLQLVGTPQKVTASTALGPDGATITASVSATALSNEGTTPFLASYDPSTGLWTPATGSVFDAATRTVTAHISTLSLTAASTGRLVMLDDWTGGDQRAATRTAGLVSDIWGVLRFTTSGLKAVVQAAVNSITGVVKFTGKAPTCTSGDIQVTAYPSDGTLKFCGQDDGSSKAVLKVVSTLAFPTDLNSGGAPISLNPPNDVLGDISQALYSASGGKDAGKVIPGGSEADVDLSLSPGAKTTVKTSLDTVAYLAGIIYSAVQVLTIIESDAGSAATKDNWAAISKGTCLAQIAASPPPTTLDADTLKSLATLGFTCAEEVVDLGVSGLVAAVAGTVAAIFEDIVQTAFLALESAVGWKTGGTHLLTMSRSQPAIEPVLGQAQADLTGLGQVEPPRIYFGGDTSTGVWNITWNSWGGAQATGTGTGVLTPPYTTSYQATVVAFDLGSCGGKAAYQKVEWYFPSQGGSFDPSGGQPACVQSLTYTCPTSGQLLTAWRNNPGIFGAPAGTVTGFETPQCWQNWAIAAILGNGNGVVVFNLAPSLHAASQGELDVFDGEVCSASNAPPWTGPAGPATCNN